MERFGEIIRTRTKYGVMYKIKINAPVPGQYKSGDIIGELGTVPGGSIPDCLLEKTSGNYKKVKRN